MEIKFKKKLNEFKYIAGIDLAMYKTGISLYNLQTNSIDFVKEIVVENNAECVVLDLYNKIEEVFSTIISLYCSNEELLIVKEQAPMQCGFKSTVATLTGLSKAHAILDLVCARGQYNVYDYIGIHSSTIKSLFKTENNSKPQKIDILNILVDRYGLDKNIITENISDSIAVIYALLNKKWNQDIKNEIKTNKQKLRSLKMVHAKEKYELYIEQLKNKLIE